MNKINKGIIQTGGAISANNIIVGNDARTSNTINIQAERVTGSVNIKSRLNSIQRSVTSANACPESRKAEFVELIDELRIALQQVTGQRPEDGERVVQSAEAVAKELSKSEPNTSFLKITIEGLKEAAKAVGDIAPNVLNTATKIAKFVSAIL